MDQHINISLEVPFIVNGKEFTLDCDAHVTFSDDPGDMKESDSAYIWRVGIGSAGLKFQDLPKDLRAAIEAEAISKAYDIENQKLMQLI